MRRVCLSLPTDRRCSPALSALLDEAAYAAREFAVEVHVLVLDSSAEEAHAEHAALLAAARPVPGVVVHHLDERAQRAFLREAVARAELPDPDLVLDLMLPARSSYGACTNRAFLIARALGCVSVHRRDSDSSYQTHGGLPVFPIHHELAFLGRPAGPAAAAADTDALEPGQRQRPVAMVAASFIGALSVDIAEIEALDPAVYHELVSLWAPADWTEQQRRELVAESFRGAGTEPFDGDRTLIGPVDPMRVDMCNISFQGVQELVPLSPATETVGSDYFLIHLVYDAKLPGVLHNRHIVNFHTPERRTDAGFLGYHLRLAKFFLSMLYLNHVYAQMTEAGERLLDDRGEVRPDAVAALLRESATLDQAENRARLGTLDDCYRRLGGRYSAFADQLAARGPRLLDEARRDIEDYALLAEVWPRLSAAAAATGVRPLEPISERNGT